jgi:hypothetical protein
MRQPGDLQKPRVSTMRKDVKETECPHCHSNLKVKDGRNWCEVCGYLAPHA